MRSIVAASAASLAVTAVFASPAGVAAQSAAGRTPGSQSSGSERVIVLLRGDSNSANARSVSHIDAVRASQAPIVSQLRSSGASKIVSTTLINSITATVTGAEAALLAKNPAVSAVIPDALISGPVVSRAPSAAATSAHTNAPSLSPSICPTDPSDPQMEPEALTNINATPAQLGSNDGTGVKVAFIADGIDINNPDFIRADGAHVIVDYQDFSGDGVNQRTGGAEAFLDASSIAAQGRQSYDLSNFVNAAHPLPAGCNITITGAAPGASVVALKVFSEFKSTLTSYFLQAIDYAVNTGVQVINESFGGQPFPDTSLDAVVDANDAAVAAGVTVVVSTGDSGTNNSLGSPSTDPTVISVGATTTFRSYLQTDAGGVNTPYGNGSIVDNNISALSSAGFSQNGNTLDLVAPGDQNWALCTADSSLYSECANLNGQPSNIELEGGTSESSPLTAGAAADVIQAYASTHGGANPTPAQVKQILMSSATDIDAPAVEQGAGLLNVAAAVNDAESMPGTTAASPSGGVLVSPGQINVQQKPGASITKTVTLTNLGSSAVTVTASTRAVTGTIGTDSGTFCMNAASPTASCPANTGVFTDDTGAQRVYQAVPFNVPANTAPSRLDFAAAFPPISPDDDPLLKLSLFEPDGTFAAFSIPQGLANHIDVEVADPPAGNWTALFFTLATRGLTANVQWAATTHGYAAASHVTPGSITIAPFSTKTVKVKVTSPSTSGDSDESLVLASPSGTTTLPITVRTMIPAVGGTFTGVLTGDNGRPGGEAQTNDYAFNVPPGKRDVDASIAFPADPEDAVVAFLINPHGQAMATSSNLTTDASGNPVSTPYVDLYHAAPIPGTWHLLVAWLSPVTGLELSMPFNGAITYNQVSVTSTVPHSKTTVLQQGTTYTYSLTIHNTGLAPEQFFADSRLNKSATMTLPEQFGHDSVSLPLLFQQEYFVPTNTSKIAANVTGTVPVTFDMTAATGDPDVSPAVATAGVTGSQSGLSAGVTLTESTGVSPGYWSVLPSEIGPYPASGAPSASASTVVTVVTKAFDAATTSSTGDLWLFANDGSAYNPVYVAPGDSATITISITPTASVGSVVVGTLYADDTDPYPYLSANADQMAAIPYTYKVGA